MPGRRSRSTSTPGSAEATAGDATPDTAEVTASDTIVVEACVTGLGEAVACVAVGARRLELCRDLAVGGLTPDLAVARAVCGAVSAPVFAMVRSSAGPFHATPREVDALGRTIADLARAGVSGIVLGFLDRERRIDRAALSDLCAVAVAASLPVTFHRAFDEIAEFEPALESLIEAGVARVLTAGGLRSAWDGRDRLARLVALAGGHITIVAGGGVRADHVGALIEATGVREVHARASAVGGLCGALGGIFETCRHPTPDRETP